MDASQQREADPVVRTSPLMSESSRRFLAGDIEADEYVAAGRTEATRGAERDVGRRFVRGRVSTARLFGVATVLAYVALAVGLVVTGQRTAALLSLAVIVGAGFWTARAGAGRA